MPKLQTLLVAVVSVLVMLVVYRFLFNPQVLLGGSSTGATCPNRWSYMNGICKPDYETQCAPFDPLTMTSNVQACNTARTCGTDWPGRCP
jgi:hypothetical protein